MKTRMQKYYDEENNNTLLRQKKNENLYENIESLENIDYKIDPNMTVLENDARNIDVDHIRKILDTKYNQTPKRRSIVIEETTETPVISLDETREYDINAILEKAKYEKDEDYEKERLKKLRDTQYDILSSLELETDSEEKNEEKGKSQEENELMDLINTITARELVTKEQKTDNIDPLDILTDLKGNDDTVVVGGVKEMESINETSPIMSLEEADAIKPKIIEEKKNDISLTNTLQFTQSDFDDFNDLKKEVRTSRALIYIAIFIVSIVFLIGLVVFLNQFLNLNWF